MSRGQETANFYFSDFDDERDYYNVSDNYSGTLFVEHTIQIHIQRKFGIFLLTIYLPSASLSVLAFVIASSICFCSIYNFQVLLFVVLFVIVI